MPEQHRVRVDEVIRIGERAAAHHGSIEAAEGATGGDEVGLVLVHCRQQAGDVVGSVPVIGIEKGHGIHPQADGVVAADQAGCGADVSVAAGQTHVFGCPGVDASAAMTVRHEHVQAWLGLGSHAFVALAKLCKGFLVVRGNHSHPRQGIAEGVLQASIIHQFTPNQLGCDGGWVGTKTVVIGRQGPKAQVVGINCSPAVASSRIDALVALQGFSPLANFAFQLRIAANGNVQDLDAGITDRSDGPAMAQCVVVPVGYDDFGITTVNQFGG